MKTIAEYINKPQINEGVFDDNIKNIHDKIALLTSVLTNKWQNFTANKTDGSKDALGNPLSPGDLLLITSYQGRRYDPKHKQVFDLGVYIGSVGRLCVYQSITGTDWCVNSGNYSFEENELNPYTIYHEFEHDLKNDYYILVNKYPSKKHPGASVAECTSEMFPHVTPNKIFKLSPDTADKI